MELKLLTGSRSRNVRHASLGRVTVSPGYNDLFIGVHTIQAETGESVLALDSSKLFSEAEKAREQILCWSLLKGLQLC